MKNEQKIVIYIVLFMLFGLCVGFYFGWKCGRGERAVQNAIDPPIIDEPMVSPKKVLPPQIVVPSVIDKLPNPDEPQLPLAAPIVFQPDTLLQYE